MLTKIPEINPLDLLYNPYQPIDRHELAELLGVSQNTIYSWQEGRRRPAIPVKKLAAMILSQWRSQSITA
ncbi:DNA-binding transcriptional regulator [Okeania sp. SIO2B3]|uniref:helix-turn-helix domain-containing protein n=1 Tax=Okeania sp. SIO2B3 TaxID=2607784 RepID=UPI0013C2919D|nr:helix-turn-helix transcriptional regulator [Okeania sp. SIO2B3]NET44854.1 helix-turn-helix transcriptional regulator [Okeania sp. SIO2B3]